MFRRSKPEDAFVAALYARTAERARAPELFEGCGIPDTLDGRFDSLALHAALTIDRLRRFTQGHVVYHSAGWGEGAIVDFAAPTLEVTVPRAKARATDQPGVTVPADRKSVV